MTSSDEMKSEILNPQRIHAPKWSIVIPEFFTIEINIIVLDWLYANLHSSFF